MAQHVVRDDAVTEVPVYAGHRVLAMFPFFNEEAKLRRLVTRMRPGLVDKLLAVNDGSTDGGPALLRSHGIEVLDQKRSGIGACIKRCIRYARENGYDVLVVMAGNDKDDPREIPRLVKPIVEDGCDYVQGSRFLEGGSSPNLPLYRRLAIRALSGAFRVFSGRPCTDITNGFRAYRLSVLDDPRIDVWQEWLDQYSYEYYLHWKVYAFRYVIAEVPVTKRYPEVHGEAYTKIAPFSGWLQILKPFVLLALRIKK